MALGEFELLVLLSILRQEDEPFANQVRRDLQENADRRVTRGALYRTLDRLAAKGLLSWTVESDDVPERGGHPRRRLSVTAAGLAAAGEQERILRRFFRGLDLARDEGR